MISSRTVLGCALLGSLMVNVGCSSIWHNLQPHRIQRLNRGAPPSIDPEFSQRDRKTQSRLARNQSPVKAPTLSANSAEIAVVRAQSPAAETQ